MTMRRFVLCRCVLLGLPLAMSGCALLGTNQPDRIFTLTPLPVTGAQSALHVTVSEPVALRVLDSERIAYRESPEEYEYYSGVEWADRAPALLQHVLIASLRNAAGIQASSDELGNAGAPVTESLENFEVEPGNLVHVALDVTYQGHTGRFEQTRQAASDKMTDLVSAFDVATGTVMRQIVQFIAGQPVQARAQARAIP